MCCLQNIAMRDYQESVTTGQTHEQMPDYKNLPRLCTGTGKSTRVSKICSPRRGLQIFDIESRGLLFFSYRCNSHNKPPVFAFKNYFQTFSASKTAPTWVNYDVASLYDL